MPSLTMTRTRKSSESPAESPSFRPDIQGVRAVAVLLVVFNHAGVGWLHGGYVGVDVFFVVSGFLITGLLMKEARRQGGISLLEFYSRRARRILPAAMVVILATVLGGLWMLNVVRAERVAYDSLWATVFAANIRFSQVGTDYFAQDQPPSPFQHFWSLAVEEQFYLVWPALLSLILFGVIRWSTRRRSSRPDDLPVARVSAALAVITVASFAYCVWLTDSDRTSAYFSTLTRTWELGIGALLAVGASHIGRLPRPAKAAATWIGLAGIAFAALRFGPETKFPGVAVALPVLGTALILAGGIGNARGGAGRLLSVGPLRFFGDISYSLYLWHWPVLVIAAGYVGEDLTLAQNLMLVAGAVGLSTLSFFLIENPLRRLKYFADRPQDALGIWPIMLVMVLFAALFAQSQFQADTRALTAQDAGTQVGTQDPGVNPSPTAVPPSAVEAAIADAVAAAAAGKPIPTGLTPRPDEAAADKPPIKCAALAGATTSPICSVGDSGASRTMMLLGDSHAQAWLPTFDAIGKSQHWKVTYLVKYGCSSLAVRVYEPGKGAFEECDRWRPWAFDQVKTIHPDLVLFANHQIPAFVGAGGKGVTDVPQLAKAWGDGAAAAIQAVKPYAKRVGVISAVPGISKDPADCLLGRRSKLATCTFPLQPKVVQLDAAAQAATTAAKAYWIDVRPWFCASGQCPTVAGRTVLFRDTTHLTQTYARALADSMLAALKLAP